jgi:hypothetical protein
LVVIQSTSGKRGEEVVLLSLFDPQSDLCIRKGLSFRLEEATHEKDVVDIHWPGVGVCTAPGTGFGGRGLDPNGRIAARVAQAENNADAGARRAAAGKRVK